MISIPAMHYALEIGSKYLLGKKRMTILLITSIAIVGVAFGVGALLPVIAITSGFEEVIRQKLLGVNADVLVMKYGQDFYEYQDVADRAESRDDVKAASPFVIQEMLLAHGSRRSIVLLKGIDPERAANVLSLSQQVRAGSLEDMRSHRKPPTETDDRRRSPLDDLLRQLGDDFDGDASVDRGSDAGLQTNVADAAVKESVAALPEVSVPSLDEANALLNELGRDGPPDIADGSWLDDEPELAPKSLPGIVVGKGLAQNLGLEIGSRVHVVSPLAGVGAGYIDNSVRIPQSGDFRVAAIFEAGFKEYDAQLVYVDLREAQWLRDQGDQVTGVELKLHNIDRAVPIARSLEADLGGPFHTTSWQELNEPLFQALRNQKWALSLSIATIIVVAAFNVIATLIMVVLEKRREVAILRAMGASRRAVVALFMMQGVVIGVVGTALGLILGGGVVTILTHYKFPLDPKVYLIDHLPMRATPTEYFITAIVAFVICSLATIAPSWWAARMTPVDGLRRD